MGDKPARMQKGATLKDVAREAGVSVAAVSYSLNGGGTVSDEVRAHVREVARRLGYRPNRSAQATRTGRNTTLGLLLPDLRNPYFPALAQALEHAARRAGYTVVLIDTSGAAQSEIDGMRHLESQGVAAAIWCQTSNLGVATIPRFIMPIVTIGIPDPNLDNVTTKDFTGGAQLARHLVERGHTRIGMITSADVSPGKDERRNGFLSEVEGKAEIVWDFQTPTTIDIPEAIYTRLGEGSVTAVMCGNDMVAIGLLRAAHQLGIAVPDELSLVGFDDIQWASIVTPGLTTIRQPVDEMAATALTLLLERLGEPDRPVRHYKVEVSLVQRDSVRDMTSENQVPIEGNQ